MQKCPVKEGLARTLKKGLKQSFLTDSGKAQSSEMVRGELQSKKAYLFYSKALLGSRVVASTTERSFPIPRCQAKTGLKSKVPLRMTKRLANSKQPVFDIKDFFLDIRTSKLAMSC